MLPIDDFYFDNINNYYFPQDLRDAVNVALILEMPLLITGEPGTGKTKLAEAISNVLSKFYKSNVRYYKFVTKSTSIYNDLLYTYDHLRHYMIIQVEGESLEKNNLDDYIKKGIITINALGEAFMDKNPSVVLVDEIDKAPRDFPNDLLDEVDNGKFVIPELNNYEIKNEGKKPFIIITSNQERSLPDPFLRRCVYYHINFPNEQDLQKIVKVHFKNKKNVENLINLFNHLREIALDKKPATAELINWIEYLSKRNFDFSKQIENLSTQEKRILKASISLLAKTQNDYLTFIQELNL